MTLHQHLAHWLVLSALVTAAAPKASRADDCDEMRLDVPGGSMEHVPTQDQGNFNDCYAVVAAEMADARRFSIKPPPNDLDFAFHTSPIECAIGSKRQIEKVGVKGALSDDGGDPCDSMPYLQDKGSCDSRVENLEPLKSDLSFLAQSYDLTNWHADGNTPKFNSRIGNALSEGLCLNFANDNPEHFLGEDLKVLELITQSAEKEVSASFERLCSEPPRKRIHTEKLSCHPSDDLSPNESKETLQEILQQLKDKTSQPLAIGFCSKVFYAGIGYQGLVPSKNGGNDVKDGCDLHEALVIGKRRVNNRCELLVQNSFGTDCDGYADIWAKNCKDGKLWVDAETLTKNITDYEYLE